MKKILKFKKYLSVIKYMVENIETIRFALWHYQIICMPNKKMKKTLKIVESLINKTEELVDD